MGLTNRLYNVILVVLGVTALLLCLAWQVAKNETNSVRVELGKEIVVLKDKIIDKDRKIAQDLIDYNESLQKSREEQARSEATLKGQLNEIQTSYRNSLLVNDGLRKQVGDLNRQVSTLSRTKLESYAKTGGNNLAVCSRVSAELERIARQYYAEREYYRTQWPMPEMAIIHAVDSSGAELALSNRITVKARLSDLKVDSP